MNNETIAFMYNINLPWPRGYMKIPIPHLDMHVLGYDAYGKLSLNMST